MGVTERKAREKEELRARILDAAMELFVRKGVDNVTIRNIADEAEYSIGTVYVYFKDKNAILHALHQKGFTELRSRFLVLLHVADPMERLKASGRVYIAFALEQPDMYNLMFNTHAPMDYLKTSEDGEWDEGEATFGFVRSVINECLANGHFQGHQGGALAYLIWSIVHGMCALHIMQRSTVSGIDNPVAAAYDEFLLMLNKF